MSPEFDIEGGLPLAFARAASVMGLMLAAGGLLYAAAIRPACLAAGVSRGLRRLNAVAVAVALGGAVLWLLAQSRDFAGDLLPGSVWATLSATNFGHLLAGRLILLTLAGAVLWRGWSGCAAGLAVAALALQGGHSHAVAMGEPGWLIAASFLHVLAAGIWLGALPSLWLVLRGASASLAASAARRFSVAGLACVAVLLVTATVQFRLLVVDLPGLAGTAYGWVVCVKMALFAGLLGLAARNRRRLTPRLADDPSGPRRLRRAVLMEIGLGVAVVCAAGVLTELQPAMHVQKLWPFGWLPSLDAAREDSDILHEVAWGGVLCLSGMACLAWAAWRRRRTGAAAGLAGVALVLWGAGHVSPLLVPAVPTIFFHSPTGFTAASVMQGAALYPAQCAGCHGAEGRGDGPLARGLPVPPANLDAAHLWMHPDGELFWWLTQGIRAPRGGLAMPGFPQLDDGQRWALIDFIRARNAGLGLSADGVWAVQVQAPDLAIGCGKQRQALSALRGGAVRILLRAGQEVRPQNGVTDVTLSGACRMADTAGLAAYAVVAPGAGAVLIDANGWLRRAAPDAARLGAPPAPLAAQGAAQDAPMSREMKM